MLTTSDRLIGRLAAKPYSSGPNRWCAEHNLTLDDWHQDNNEITDAEKVILDWALAIAQWGDVHHPATDYVAHPIAARMLSAFRAALDFNCGRLDCGTLDSWALSTGERWGIGEEEL